jgi:uncharacterized protein (TIGR03032 family)
METSPPSSSDAAAESALASVHTTSFVSLIQRLGVSIAVSTYQAGKLVLLRAGEGMLNTHFRTFDRPMGVAISGGRLAVGATNQIWEFHNVPAAGPKLSRLPDGSAAPGPQHDACYLPRSLSFTGNIQIHEMVWTTADLVFVNTRFSCLCRRSVEFNFVPIWRPPFITHLAPEDRCHLNGLGLRDRKPRYITALGQGNESGSWRANKSSGGIVMDLDTNEVICRGLSMPHSPRWHDGKLWVLASGDGEIGHIDLDSGKYQTVAQLPGFTRGLDFVGPYAFIGLSQVRETATFSGIKIAERPQDQRRCGVWVVDIRDGKTVAFVRFETGVQEIFAVSAMLKTHWPDVVIDNPTVLSESFVLPDEALKEVDPKIFSALRATDEAPQPVDRPEDSRT